MMFGALSDTIRSDTIIARADIAPFCRVWALTWTLLQALSNLLVSLAVDVCDCEVGDDKNSSPITSSAYLTLSHDIDNSLNMHIIPQ